VTARRSPVTPATLAISAGTGAAAAAPQPPGLPPPKPPREPPSDGSHWGGVFVNM
jgi:hypothetical protein